MTKKKWDWLSKRLSELKISRKDFANRISWPAPRISEMINNNPVNGGKIRNFPQEKLKLVSDILEVDFYSLWAYNVGESDSIEFVNQQDFEYGDHKKEIIMAKKPVSQASKELGLLMKDFLKKANITQERAAFRLGLSYQSSLNHYLSGRSEVPIDLIKKFCQEFNVSVDFLLGTQQSSSPRAYLPSAQIASRIREMGLRRGLSRDSMICDAVPIHRNTILDIQNLKTTPRVDTLDKFAKVLNCSVSDIIYENIPAKDEYLEPASAEQLDIKNVMHKNNLKYLRQLKQISAASLGHRVGVSQATITRWEQGHYPLSFDYIEKLSNALGCDPWELLPAEWQPRTKIIDDQSRFFRILQSVNRALKEHRLQAPEESKMRFVMYLYNEGYGREYDDIANDNEISRVVKIKYIA